MSIILGVIDGIIVALCGVAAVLVGLAMIHSRDELDVFERRVGATIGFVLAMAAVRLASRAVGWG